MIQVMLLGFQKGDRVDSELIEHLGLHGGKLYVVDFFASWCGSCEKELPLISRADRQVNHDEVEIIGIDIDTDPAKAAAFQQRFRTSGKLTFRVVNDPMKLVVSKFKPIGMPALYYIHKGEVVDVIYGAVDDIDKKILKDVKQ